MTEKKKKRTLLERWTQDEKRPWTMKITLPPKK